MSAYPNYPLQRETSTERDGGQDARRATNGALRLRVRYAADRSTFSLVHLLTYDEKTALEAHYQANKTASFAFVWPEDRATYTVVYGAAPVYVRGASSWTARVKLLQV
jgi:hypothetical protein